MKVTGRLLVWACIVAFHAVLAPAEKANAATIGYNVEGGLDLNCTSGVTAVSGGCAFRAMFDLVNPVMDGAFGNVPMNIMFELLDSSGNVLSSYNGPFNAQTVIVQASGVVTESDITDTGLTGYLLSANFWAWDRDDFFVDIDDMNLNGVSISAKPIAPVPLPAAVWLLLSAIAGLGVFNWRRSKVSAVPA